MKNTKKELEAKYEKYIDSQSRCMNSHWTKIVAKPKSKKGGKSSGKK